MKWTCLLVIQLIIIMSVSCNKQSNQEPSSHSTESKHSMLPALTKQRLELSEPFIDQTSLKLEQLLQNSHLLNQKIDLFLINPNKKTWKTLKQQWLLVHESWHLCDFYFSLIYTQQQFSSFAKHISNIHATPIIGGYLDRIEGYPTSGIVNDITVPMTQISILNQHQTFDETEASIGLHVIEFFLWEQVVGDYQLTSRHVDPQAPTINDIDKNHPITRRRQYLKILGEQLVADSHMLKDGWDDIKQNIKQNNKLSLTIIIDSITRQFQQLELHSIYQSNETMLSKPYHWQLAAIDQLIYWTNDFNTQTNENDELLLLISQLQELKKRLKNQNT